MPPQKTSSKSRKKAPDRKLLNRAIKELQRNLEESPQDLRAHVRLARAYRLLNEKEKSAASYRNAIEGYTNQNKGLLALALSKELIAFDPENLDLLLGMARLYARFPQGKRDAGRVAVPLPQRIVVPITSPSSEEEIQEKTEIPTDTQPKEADETAQKLNSTAFEILDEPENPDKIVTLPGEEDYPSQPPPPAPPAEAFLVDDGDEEAKLVELSADPAWRKENRPKVPASTLQSANKIEISSDQKFLRDARMGDIPLLSSLSEDAFVTISKAMRPISLHDGEVLFEAGEDARSFYIVASGSVDVQVGPKGEERTIASLSEGEVVGLFGLYTGRKRNARVVASGPVLVFEITDRILAKLVSNHPGAKKPLAQFYKQRLLEISLCRSPLFRDFSRDKRLAIIERFTQKRYTPKEAIISPGQVTLGLYLVIRGKVIIVTRDSGILTIEAELSRGQFFGCISALSGMPTLASAECLEETVLAVLSHSTFSGLLKLQPELNSLPRRLREEKLLVTPTIFVGNPEALISKG